MMQEADLEMQKGAARPGFVLDCVFGVDAALARGEYAISFDRRAIRKLATEIYNRAKALHVGWSPERVG